MKRGTIIGIAFAVYTIAMIGMFVGVDQYIKAKDDRLRADIYRQVNSIFKNQSQFVDIAYSGYKVEYEKVPIPKKPITLSNKDKLGNNGFADWNKKRLADWNDSYGDLKKLYRTFYKKSDLSLPFDYKDGWNLVVLEHDNAGIYTTWLFPYAVGFIKQKDYYWSDSYYPSVEEAVNDAFDFYTSNEKSSYYEYFEKGCFDKIVSKVFDAENDYYHMSKDEQPRFFRSGYPLFEETSIDNRHPSFQNGLMYNGYYKVFLGSTQPETYSIKKYEWGPDEKEKKELWKNWAIGLTVLLFLIIIPLWIIDRKHQKVKDETLYDKLKRLCNPANFLKEYNKEKVDKANEIYKKLLETSPDNKEALDEIQREAVSELGVTLIDAEKLAELKEKVNPKKFLTPYNAEKVTLSNELFAILSKENLTYNEMVDVEEQSKKL